MKQSEAFALLKKFAGQSNILTAPVAFIRYTGTLSSALFLSQLLYWTSRSEDGWFYKSYLDWEKETCLSAYEVSKASKLLKAKGILQTKLKKVNGAPVVHYKVLEAAFLESILKFLESPLCENDESIFESPRDGYEKEPTTLDTEKTTECVDKDYKRSPPKITNKETGPPFTTERFLTALSAFEQHRKEKRAAVTPTERLALYRRLAGWGEEQATRALIYSTSQGYKGCFQEKGNGTNKQDLGGAAQPSGDFQFTPKAIIS